MSNPFYSDKETRERLGVKSIVCFGTKGKWKKLVNKSGLTIEAVEKQMDIIIEYKQKQQEAYLDELRQRSEQNDNGRSKQLQQAGQTEATTEAPAGDDGNEERSGQSGDEPTTSESVDGSVESSDIRKG